MRYLLLLIFCCSISLNAQTVEDDFEGNGTIAWEADPTQVIIFDVTNPNQYQEGINTSSTVLKYDDNGSASYANIRFNVPANFDLSSNNSFSLKIYIPTNGISGSQANQISLKLQNGSLSEPWVTQSEIIKPVILDQWQEITFDFESDAYIPTSPDPINRTDFNRVVLQVNGENNNDSVIAYIDDFLYDGIIDIAEDPVYDNLVWSDEFNGTGAIDDSKWFHQTQLPAGGSWYNGEVQHYTNREDNSFLNGGYLNIVAKKETFNDQSYTKQYTSARLNAKFAFTYGKVEVRAQLPSGLGTWPAIWMLGQNISESGAYWETEGYGTTPWPQCGEIDIMEHWGNNQNYVQSAMHTPSSFGNTFNKGGQTVSTASTDFHIYTLEWFLDKIVFSVDGIQHYTYNPGIKNSDTWPFDLPQYLLLNIAIEPSIDAGFTESSMVVDYVRVYQESALTIQNVDTKPELMLFPNPVGDNLQINNIDRNEIELNILDIKGSIVYQNTKQINNQKLTLNVSFLKQGMYFINLSFKDGKTSTLKFVKN
jgi:beta-glucanase (GH16 family)